MRGQNDEGEGEGDVAGATMQGGRPSGLGLRCWGDEDGKDGTATKPSASPTRSAVSAPAEGPQVLAVIMLRKQEP